MKKNILTILLIVSMVLGATYAVAGESDKEKALLKIKKTFPLDPEIKKKYDQYQEDLDELGPSKRELIEHAGRDAKIVAMYAIKNKGKVLADDNLQTERQKICNDCPYNKNNKCLKCGCGISGGILNKTKYIALHCPIEKW